MFGCLRRLGCLFVLALIVLGYFTRGWWYEPARGALGRWSDRGAEADTVARWEPVTQAAAARGEQAVRALASPRGPVYVSLRPGELASYAFLSLAANALPASAEHAEAMVQGERVYLRSVVSLRDFAGALGQVGGFLADRDTLRLGGTFDVLAPGRAQFRVTDVQLGSFPVPAKAIPALIRRVRRGAVAPDVAPDALEIPVPSYIGDVRVARGRITLYKRN